MHKLKNILRDPVAVTILLITVLEIINGMWMNFSDDPHVFIGGAFVTIYSLLFSASLAILKLMLVAALALLRKYRFLMTGILGFLVSLSANAIVVFFTSFSPLLFPVILFPSVSFFIYYFFREYGEYLRENPLNA